MNHIKIHFHFLLLLICLLSFLTPHPSSADELPPDREVSILKSALTDNPDDGASWIRLGNLQRIMGYSHDARESFTRASEAIKKLSKEEKRELAGAYYTARAWLEYDATDWQAALDHAKMAVKYGSNHESRLVQGLAMAATPFSEEKIYAELNFLRPISSPGPANRRRNYYWIRLVWEYHQREVMELFYWSHEGLWEPAYHWAEMSCRRDYGYVFESYDEWAQAKIFYQFSVDRSAVSKGSWAVRHERLTPLQSTSDPPMPFWTNADGGYVTGSLMAYTKYACEQLLQAGAPEERDKWAIHTGDGASRSLAVYINQPWPWLWRSLAWQVQGDLKRAERDLAQAKAEFEESGIEAPLFTYAKGHELIMKEKYGDALPWLEKAAQECPNASCWTDLGLARVMSYDRDGALSAYTKALALSPDLAVALHNRGMLHLQQGRPDMALTDLTRAAEIAPQDQQIITDLQRAKLANK